MKKALIFLLSVLVVAAGAGGWFWWASKTSNPWNAATIGDIPAPMGYTRVEAGEGSFGGYLRALPLRKRGARVRLYRGGEAKQQYLSTGVVDLRLLSNNEQCADATMRLRGEYLWQNGRYDEICFTNVKGRRMKYSGGGSRKAFENYMRDVYGWCNTASVFDETKPRSILDVEPGDVLVYPARRGHRYGHALIVVDVARRGKNHVAIMCAEGNTPARDVHILRNLNPLNNPWFFFDGTEKDIWVSVFRFNKNELRHY